MWRGRSPTSRAARNHADPDREARPTSAHMSGRPVRSRLPAGEPSGEPTTTHDRGQPRTLTDLDPRRTSHLRTPTDADGRFLPALQAGSRGFDSHQLHCHSNDVSLRHQRLTSSGSQTGSQSPSGDRDDGGETGHLCSCRTIRSSGGVSGRDCGRRVVFGAALTNLRSVHPICVRGASVAASRRVVGFR